MQIDSDFPGGNGIIEAIDGDAVHLHQDLRDTDGDWFYWHFRVRGGEGRTLRFHFTKSNVLGARGPCISRDGGMNWTWLETSSVQENSFEYKFGAGETDVRFSLGIPYLESNWNQFLERHHSNGNIVRAILCKTAKGRNAELIRVGCIDGKCSQRVLLTCRHHSCEASSSFVLEGLLDSVLKNDELGNWFCQNIEVMAIPFIDKDGVEDGDQGKNRKPHDHNRDYAGSSIYPTVRALRNVVPEWSGGRLCAFIDFHCPWIRGARNEVIYFVGSTSGKHWDESEKLAEVLERVRTGPLLFERKNDLPFGLEWNTYDGPRKNSQRWAQELPGVRLATTLEFPYANASGGVVTAESARAFGRDLAVALREYLHVGA